MTYISRVLLSTSAHNIIAAMNPVTSGERESILRLSAYELRIPILEAVRKIR